MATDNKNLRDRENQSQWQNAEHEGDWQLAESQTEDTAAMLTSFHPDDTNQRLYATGDDPVENNENDADEDAEEPRDWGHTDPLDSPLPDSTDPSGPGSAV